MVQNWTAEPVYAGTSVAAFANPVDTSGVTDPAPQSVYQSYALSASGTTLAYQIQVPDGSYHVRLHFVEPSLSSFVGSRKFDIQLQGTTVQTDFDILAAAGARFKAVQKTYTLIASGGSGITLQLNNKSNFGTPIISGIEILADDPYGVAAPTFNLDLSGDNGATWSPLAADQPVDRFGRGSYTWTVPANQPLGSQYLVRVTSNDGIHAQDVLDASVLDYQQRARLLRQRQFANW